MAVFLIEGPEHFSAVIVYFARCILYGEGPVHLIDRAFREILRVRILLIADSLHIDIESGIDLEASGIQSLISLRLRVAFLLLKIVDDLLGKLINEVRVDRIFRLRDHRLRVENFLMHAV